MSRLFPLRIRSKAMPGKAVVVRPVTTDSLTTEAGDVLLTESGQEIKKET